MKVAVVGSRNARVNNLKLYLPPNTTEIVSGGASGVDRCARECALANGLRLTEFLPDYAHYRQGAPLRRNDEIVDYADRVLAFWDGQSAGTRYVIERCRELQKPIMIIYV